MTAAPTKRRPAVWRHRVATVQRPIGGVGRDARLDTVATIYTGQISTARVSAGSPSASGPFVVSNTVL